jgi:tetratricopeptide (TPR) repeat protein
MNFDPETIKQNAKRMSEMSDEDLKRASYSMPNMPGMPPGGLNPEMLRNYSSMLNGMDDAQLKNMADMAKNMGYNPMGGMPNMRNMPNPYGGAQQSQSGSSVPKPAPKKEEDPFAKPEDQRKFESVNEIKNKANDLFKANDFSKASEKYYEAINAVRTTKCLKNSSQGNQLEINCRLNLALCKIKQEEYDVAIDQCERVLLEETANIKALYRISVALNSQGKQLEAWSYIKRAYAITPQDKAISDLHSTLKTVKEQHQQKQKSEAKKEESEQSKDEEPKADEGKNDDDSSDEDERAKSLKSGFKFTSDEKQTTHKPKQEVKIEEEKVPAS